jgi:hypothetical protein
MVTGCRMVIGRGTPTLIRIQPLLVISLAWWYLDKEQVVCGQEPKIGDGPDL